VEFSLGHGDLPIMGGACQHDWVHRVPKTKKPVHSQMSVTIRHSKDTATQEEILTGGGVVTTRQPGA
jgi:alkylated DNA repair dioxygenase AlkB